MANLRTGMTVTIGKFAQEGKHADPTPLSWIVLNVTGTKALLLSQYAIDEEPFHGGPDAMFLPDSRKTTWAKSTIRSKLNGEFYESTFSDV